MSMDGTQRKDLERAAAFLSPKTDADCCMDSAEARRIARVLRSLAAANQASALPLPEGWQPIETAPKGRKLIVGYPNKLGKWRTVMGHYYLPGTLLADDQSDDCDDDGYAPEGWYEESESHEHILFTEETPTHWMPLPAAPLLVQPEGGE